ncbi:hypothetical protein AB0E01_22985 [Nocardia vinacea]|uniref:hypothetical protein n=1 Tax=Nocardia vinacea TaxID=96468 RepID=UPI0033E5D031
MRVVDVTDQYPSITQRPGESQRIYRRGKATAIVIVRDHARFLPTPVGEPSRHYRVTVQITSGSASTHDRLARRFAEELDLPTTDGADLHRFYRTKEDRPQSSYAFTHTCVPVRK